MFRLTLLAGLMSIGCTGSPPANASRCQDACDKQKSSACIDAQTHDACYHSCESAGASVVDLYVRCVDASICDPGCQADLVGSGGTTTGGTSGGTTTGGTTTGQTDPVTICRGYCAQYGQAGCLAPADEQACEDRCASANATTRSQFESCAQGYSDCRAVTCYDAFNPGAAPAPPPADVDACKKGCDDLGFFTCVTASEQTDCRDRCAEKSQSADSLESFVACVNSHETDCSQAHDCYLGL